MADPFGVETKSTSAQWVPTGSFGTPRPKDWRLENAIVHGYKASGWVYSCASIQAKHVAELPWRVWETTSSGDLRPIGQHDVAFLIENPNEHQSREFQMTMRALHLLLGGNHLDKIVTVGGSRDPQPAELWGMRPDSVSPLSSREEWLEGYEVRTHTGVREETLPPSRVVHGMLADPSDPYWGMSPIRAVGPVVDMDRTQVTWNRQLVENDASPAGVFVDPNIHGERDRKLVKDALKKHFSGPLNSREPLVLSAGAQWHQLGISPRELDWIESRKFSVGEICTAMGLLTSRFLMDAATYNNLEQAILYEWENGALPIAGVIGNALALRLLSREDRRRGLRILPDVSGVPVLRNRVHQAAESFERLVKSTVPPQSAAAIVDLPVGRLPHGQRAYKPAMLEEITAEPGKPDEPTDEDL